MDIMDEFPDEGKVTLVYKCPEKDCDFKRAVDGYYHMICRLHGEAKPLMTLDGRDRNGENFTEEDYLPEEQRREILKIIISTFTKDLTGNKYFKTLGDFWKKNGFQEYADESYSYIKD